MASNKYKFIILMCLSVGLAFCWYPLAKLGSMQIEGSQLLFFAFSAASVLTVAFMAYQIEMWRKRTLALLIYALIGGVSTVLLHYSLLLGNPIVMIAIFCIAMLATLLLDRLSKGENLVAIEFLMIISLVVVAVSILLIIGGVLVPQWSQLLAVLAGIGFYRLSLLGDGSNNDIPIMSRIAALFIASTWLVGMVLIFSPRSTSFPQDNAAIFSALYGALVLIPVIAAVVYVMQKQNLRILLLWIALLLGANFISLVL